MAITTTMIIRKVKGVIYMVLFCKSTIKHNNKCNGYCHPNYNKNETNWGHNIPLILENLIILLRNIYADFNKRGTIYYLSANAVIPAYTRPILFEICRAISITRSPSKYLIIENGQNTI